MQSYANLFVIDSIAQTHLRTNTLMQYAKEFLHTNKGVSKFSIYQFHFIAGRKKKFTQFVAELKQLFITITAAFCFCEPACIILANEK